MLLDFVKIPKGKGKKMDDFQRKQYEQRMTDERLAKNGFTNGSNMNEMNKEQIKRQQQRQANSQPGCFATGTLVNVMSRWLPIEEVCEHQSITSLSSDHLIDTSKVIKIRKYNDRRIWQIFTTETREPIRCTGGHPFHTYRGKVAARNLLAGDQLAFVDPNGQLRTNYVSSVDLTNQIDTVYNLIVQKNHNYFVYGAAVHSFSHAAKPRGMIHDLIYRLTQPSSASYRIPLTRLQS